VAGEAGGLGHAPAEFRAAGRDPPVAGLHPPANRPGPGAGPAPAAMEKLLEDALIMGPTAAYRIDTMLVRDMLEALIAGQGDPRVLADLARGRMKAKRAALVEALTGRFDDLYGELASILAQPDRLADHTDRCADRPDRGAHRRDRRRPGRECRRHHTPRRRP
jgi:hypothetical protein